MATPIGPRFRINWGSFLSPLFFPPTTGVSLSLFPSPSSPSNALLFTTLPPLLALIVLPLSLLLIPLALIVSLALIVPSPFFPPTDALPFNGDARALSLSLLVGKSSNASNSLPSPYVLALLSLDTTNGAAGR